MVNGGLIGRRPFTIAQLELAGCRRALIQSIRVALANHPNLRVVPALLAGRMVDRFSIREGKTLVELFVSRSSGLPVRLALIGKRLHGSSDLRYPEAP